MIKIGFKKLFLWKITVNNTQNRFKNYQFLKNTASQYLSHFLKYSQNIEQNRFLFLLFQYYFKIHFILYKIIF